MEELTEAPASEHVVSPVVEAPPAVAAGPGRGLPWPALGVAFVVLLGVIVRFVTVSALWLDEAQTVAIAKVPLRQLPEALRHDGAPPLFYVLLHGWIRVFGDSNLSVRSLPGLFAVAALPLMWLAGRRIGGPKVAWAAVVLLAASPFAVRYATETRMYSMIVLLVLVGYLATMELLERPGSLRAAVGVAGVTCALLFSHYWSLYLLAVVGAIFVAVALRGPSPAREGARRGLVAMVVGSLFFVPWLPSFLYQLAHTGTPWGGSGRLRNMIDTVFSFSSGYWDPGLLLGMTTYALIALALVGRPVDARRVELDLRTRPGARHLAVAGFGTLAVAILATVAGGSAFAVRYAAVLYPLVILLAAFGTAVFLDRRVRYGVLAAAVVFGFWGITPNVFGDRTSAPRVAAALKAGVRAGDVVAYCPDQLGPSVSRLLPTSFPADQLTFPRRTGPQLVDWVDYAKVNKASDPTAFAQLLLDRAGPTGTVWVVWAPGYRTFKDKCQGILGTLDLARRDNSRPVKLPKNFEHPGLIRFPPS